MGTITENQLAEKLANAKKIMNMVESGGFVKGQIDESLMIPQPTDDAYFEENQINEKKNIYVNNVKESKLPDAVKKIMIDTPITYPEISLNEGLDLKIAQKARQLMEKDGSIKQPSKTNTSTLSKTNNININELTAAITPIIENAIRKILDEKLNQILTAQQTMSLNENLVLKVGNSVFKGKITGVKKNK